MFEIPTSRITLHHGDCVEVMRGMADNSVDLVCTDIPYDEANRASNGLRDLDKGIADVATFDLVAFLEGITRVCRGSFYVFCGFQQLSTIDGFFRQAGITRRCIVWEKTNPLPMNAGHVWLSGIELCVYGKKAGAPFNDFYRNTVLRYPSGTSKLHKTQKPLALMEELVRISSNRWDTVLDPCMGSGTTGVACVKLNRHFVGIEQDGVYYRLARKQIEVVQYAPRQLELFTE